MLNPVKFLLSKKVLCFIISLLMFKNKILCHLIEFINIHLYYINWFQTLGNKFDLYPYIVYMTWVHPGNQRRCGWFQQSKGQQGGDTAGSPTLQPANQRDSSARTSDMDYISDQIFIDGRASQRNAVASKC